MSDLFDQFKWPETTAEENLPEVRVSLEDKILANIKENQGLTASQRIDGPIGADQYIQEAQYGNFDYTHKPNQMNQTLNDDCSWMDYMSGRLPAPKAPKELTYEEKVEKLRANCVKSGVQFSILNDFPIFQSAEEKNKQLKLFETWEMLDYDRFALLLGQIHMTKDMTDDQWKIIDEIAKSSIEDTNELHVQLYQPRAQADQVIVELTRVGVFTSTKTKEIIRSFTNVELNHIRDLTDKHYFKYIKNYDPKINIETYSDQVRNLEEILEYVDSISPEKIHSQNYMLSGYPPKPLEFKSEGFEKNGKIDEAKKDYWGPVEAVGSYKAPKITDLFNGDEVFRKEYIDRNARDHEAYKIKKEKDKALKNLEETLNRLKSKQELFPMFNDDVRKDIEEELKQIEKEKNQRPEFFENKFNSMIKENKRSAVEKILGRKVEDKELQEIIYSVKQEVKSGSINPSVANSKELGEVGKAAYRVAATQMNKGSKLLFTSILPNDQVAIQSFLNSDFGTSFISMVNGLALTYGMKENEMAQNLATELRVNGLATVGNVAVEEVLSVISSAALDALKKEETAEELPEELLIDNEETDLKQSNVR